MLKKLLIIVLAFAGISFGQVTTHTPTLEGTYNWSGFDTFTFGNLGFSTTPTQCPTGQVMSGFQNNFTPNCITGVSYTSNFTNTTGAAVGATDTTITLTTSTSGYPTSGCVIVDYEFMCYSSLDANGVSLDGVSRGQYSATPGLGVAHNVNTPVFSVIAAFSPKNQAPGVVIFGLGSSAVLAVNDAHPDEDNPGAVLEVNSGLNQLYVGSNGTIIQGGRYIGTCCNLLNPSTIGLIDTLPLPQDYIYSSYNVMQTTNTYQTQQPIGFGGGIVGGVTFAQPPTIPAPILQSIDPRGATAYTYVCQDHAGLVPGTPATLNMGTLVYGLVVQCPRGAGVVAYDILRTAGGSTQGLIASNVSPGTTYNDPPGSTATAASVISSNTAQAFINGLNYVSAGDVYDLNLAVSTSPLCLDSSHKLTQTGCTGGGSGLTLSCTSGVSCNLVGSTWDITASGSAGSGNVATGTFGQMGGYGTTGVTTGGAPNVFSLNPGWSLNQINGLFSRFTGATTTAYSITSNVVTMQSVNAYNAGDVVYLLSFPTSTFFNSQPVTVLSTGLSNSQFEFAFTHANTSGTVTESGVSSINIPAQPVTSQGVVIIPPGLIDNPSSLFTNSSLVGPTAQVIDTRKGMWFQQLSGYGVKCDAQNLYVTITAGSALINVGSDFSSTTQPIGMTMVVGQQVGYGNTGTQNTWTPTVTGFTYPNVTMSSNAPFSYTGFVTFGTNNQAAFQRAFNDVGQLFPLHIPQCNMLTDTVRWNGASLIGEQMNYTNIQGFPGHDVLQQQDGVPIVSWSINTATGVTTFTIPSYSAHHILAASDYPAGSGIAGDSINLRNFPVSTFFNNQNVYIATHPTPTTFTVNSVFGQSSSTSSTEAGLAAPNTSVGLNGLRVENLQLGVNNSIDGSFQWNQYSASGTLTVEPPYYRPAQEFGQPMNNPLAPGWGSGQVNGVATIAQNTAVMCVPTGGRQPVTGTTIVFPYQTGGLFTATVSSTAGSCSTGFNPITLSSAFPNTAGYTAAQAEWFTYTTPQTLAVAMPGIIHLPYPITLNLPFPPIPGWESNVSSHGRIIIGSQEWDYMGDNFGGTAGGSPTITLRNGPTSVNGGSGYAVGSVVFPLNPCQAMYNNPWPVVPTINTGAATPVNATYYAGVCGGNAGISLPMSDANAWAPFGNDGFSIAHFQDITFSNTSTNPLGNNNNNGSMGIFEQGNYTGYGNTFDDLRMSGLWGGFIQGPASVNQNGIRAVGPTSTGQSLTNCTLRTGYGIVLMNMSQSNIDRCDTYSTEASPYDGTVVGASTGLFMAGTISEQDGGSVTGVSQMTIKDYNNEPENGNHFESPVSVESDVYTANWIGTIFEGGYNIFGGEYQIFHGTQLSNPVFVYGSNNSFEHMYNLNTGYFGTGVYTGNGFYNWGNFTQGECSNGSGGGAFTFCGIGMVQGYNGHDAMATLMGDPTHPNANLLGGMILPGEFAEAGAVQVWDGTELHWGSHTECALTTTSECIYQQFDGFNGYIYIGPFQRITDARDVLKLNIKAKNTGTFNFRVLLSAQDPGSGSCSSPNYSLSTMTFTATSTGWTPVTMPVDFTGLAGCTLGVQFDSATVANTLEIGYFNFVPFPGQLYVPLGTHTIGNTCPVSGEISIDSAHLWICQPTTGVQFGSGTWQQH